MVCHSWAIRTDQTARPEPDVLMMEEKDSFTLEPTPSPRSDSRSPTPDYTWMFEEEPAPVMQLSCSFRDRREATPSRGRYSRLGQREYFSYMED